MNSEEVLERLHPSLCLLVESELKAGNEIAWANESNWSTGKVWIVSLKKPFARRYDDLPNIRFLAVNDPHYWGEEWNAQTEHETQSVITPFIAEKTK